MGRKNPTVVATKIFQRKWKGRNRRELEKGRRYRRKEI
jgi:hypothetical protein